MDERNHLKRIIGSAVFVFAFGLGGAGTANVDPSLLPLPKNLLLCGLAKATTVIVSFASQGHGYQQRSTQTEATNSNYWFDYRG